MLPIFKKAGVSLVEAVVYVALLAVLLVAVTWSLLAISKTARELESWQVLQSEGSAIMDRLTREIRAASGIAQGSFSVNPGLLVLSGDEMPNVEMGVDNNADLYLNAGGGAITLTGRSEVRSLIFRQVVNGSVQAVRVELVLGTKPGLVDKTINLYNTIILRSSYGN